ncbi:DNA repair protein RecO [Gracilimonas tropica]|uniref:DNA repair protein RecO n=1 Tax=Gracilimonas tropica TaxID=454600 RepID=UPI00037174B5|nr:DNA repair protein RecO [Gracilimonas tropica]
MITHTRVIILRMIDYQDSSFILTVLSEEHGKIALIAKGAKRPKNKLSGILQVGSILDAVYYYKQTRGVQTLTEASTAYSADIFRKHFDRAAILYSVLELLGQLVHEHEVNTPVFVFAEKFIQWLGEAEEVHPQIFPYAQIRLAEITGIGLIDTHQQETTYAYLNITSGNISDRSEDEMSYKLSENQTRFISLALHSKSSSIFGIMLENGELKQLVHHLDVYFKYHIDGYKERKSDAIFEQMLQVNS